MKVANLIVGLLLVLIINFESTADEMPIPRMLQLCEKIIEQTDIWLARHQQLASMREHFEQAHRRHYERVATRNSSAQFIRRLEEALRKGRPLQAPQREKFWRKFTYRFEHFSNKEKVDIVSQCMKHPIPEMRYLGAYIAVKRLGVPFHFHRGINREEIRRKINQIIEGFRRWCNSPEGREFIAE